MYFKKEKMKKMILPALAITVLMACNNTPKADNAATTATKEVAATTGLVYTISDASLVTWTGSKPTGKHSGTFKLKEGSFSVADNIITGGSFVIDINTLNNTDITDDVESKQKLEGHLKSADFFEVSKFPTSKFEITGVTAFKADSSNKTILLKDATHTISGNLTLKGKTQNISFPAKVTLDANTLTANADFNIDRTLWDLNYKGPGSTQDWIIAKEVNLKLSISASKK